MKKLDISELVMDLESDYYLKVENQLLGPVSWLEIVHLYDLQTINENDFYSCSENGPWVRFFESNLGTKIAPLAVLVNKVKSPPPIPNIQPQQKNKLIIGLPLPVKLKVTEFFNAKTNLIFGGIFFISICLLIVFYSDFRRIFDIIPITNNTFGDVISPIRNYGKEWKKIDISSLEIQNSNDWFIDIECWNNDIFFIKTDTNKIIKSDYSKWTTVLKPSKSISNFYVTGPNTLVTSISYNSDADWVLVNDKDANKEISFKEKSDTNNHYLFRINKDTYNIFESSGSGQILKNGQPYFSRMQESDIIKEGYWNKSYYDLLKKAKKKQEEFTNTKRLWIYHTANFELISVLFLENDKVRIATSQENASETILIDKFQSKIMKGWGNSDKTFWIVNNQGTVWKRENSKMVPITNPPSGNNSFVDFTVTPSGKVFGITNKSIFYLD